jgi:hypothetical protein
MNLRLKEKQREKKKGVEIKNKRNIKKALPMGSHRGVFVQRTASPSVPTFVDGLKVRSTLRKKR